MSQSYVTVAWHCHTAALRAGPIDATARVNHQQHRPEVTIAIKKWRGKVEQTGVPVQPSRSMPPVVFLYFGSSTLGSRSVLIERLACQRSSCPASEGYALNGVNSARRRHRILFCYATFVFSGSVR